MKMESLLATLLANLLPRLLDFLKGPEFQRLIDRLIAGLEKLLGDLGDDSDEEAS